MNKIKRITFIMRVWLLKRKADSLASETGVQQFVVKINGKPAILGKDMFRHMKQHHVFPVTLTVLGLKQISLYYTRP